MSCAAYLAALLHLRSAAFQYREPLHKARKQIFRGAFVRERGKEKAISSSKLCAAVSFKKRLFMSEFSMSGRPERLSFSYFSFKILFGAIKFAAKIADRASL